MNRLGLNRGGYHGETIPIDAVLRDILAAAHRHRWIAHPLAAEPHLTLPTLVRPPRAEDRWAPRIYISAGIHGDEPAGPLAVRQLVDAAPWPDHAWIYLCPCLNPTGFPRNSRTTASGIDLNRDYRNPQSPEIRAHIAWLQLQPMFDLTLCLHEDWESAGFYLYELNPMRLPSLAPTILDAVRRVCPIDPSPMIDGREAHGGLIRPSLDPANRPEWPEAFFLIQNKTRLSYTLEAPSDFALDLRVAALVAGTLAAVRAIAEPLSPAPPIEPNPPLPG